MKNLLNSFHVEALEGYTKQLRLHNHSIHIGGIEK